MSMMTSISILDHEPGSRRLFQRLMAAVGFRVLELRGHNGHERRGSLNGTFAPWSRDVEPPRPAVDLTPVRQALRGRDLYLARSRLEKALDEAPESPEAHMLMGVLQECLNRPHAAYHAYRRALACDPGFVPVHGYLQRYCERFGLDFRVHSQAANPAAGGSQAMGKDQRIR